MSRSYRKSFRTPWACTKPDSMREWKEGYRRSMRRETNQLINKLDLDNIEEDETYFPTNPETDVRGGNNWEGPHDGYRFEPDAKKFAQECEWDKAWHITQK